MTVSPLFVRRPENADLARKIVMVLTGVNDEITDASLKSATGAMMPENKHAIGSALKELARSEPPIHFRRIKSYGWKRLHDVDLVAHSEVDLKKISRGARRGRKRLGSVRFEALTSEGQLQAARNNTRFMAIEDASLNTAPRRNTTSSTIPDLQELLKKLKGESV